MLRWIFILIVFCVPAVACGAGYLDIQDSCLVLQGLKPGEVYLQSVGACTGRPGRVFLENNKPGEHLRVYVNGQDIGEQMVLELGVADVKGLLDKGEEMSKNYQLPHNPYEAAMKVKAEEVSRYYNSDEFQAKVETQAKQMLESSLGAKVAEYYSDGYDGKKLAFLEKDERIYVFVSSSMPMHVVRNYASDIAKLGDHRIQMVMRGFIGGMQKIVPTTHFIAESLKKNPGCELAADNKCEMLSVDFLVDPLLFQRYDINQVPAFVYVKNLVMKNTGGSEGFKSNIETVGSHLKLFGDAKLGYILGKIAQESGSDKLEVASDKL